MLPHAVYALIVTSLLSLGACAPARSERMVPPPAGTEFPANSVLRGSIALRDVGGGEETAWHPSVGDKELREAFLSALQQHGLLQTDDAEAHFRLNVFLIDLSNPGAGFSLTVNSLVRYTLRRADSGAVIFDDVINAPHTATMADGLFQPMRLRVANEGSIRANIVEFLERLNAQPISAALDDQHGIGTAVWRGA